MATINQVGVGLSGATGTGAFVGSASPTLSNTTVGNLNLNVNTLSSTVTNGPINIAPNGTGNLLIFNSTDLGIGSQNVQIVGSGQNNLFLGGFANAVGQQPTYCLVKSRSTVPQTYVAVQNGDSLGSIVVRADDGTAYRGCGGLSWSASGAVSAGIVPTQLALTTQNTSGATTTALTISNAQVATFASSVIAPTVLPGNLSLTGNTLSSTDTNGVVNIAPNGTGCVAIGSATPFIGVAAGLNLLELGKSSTRGIMLVGSFNNATQAGGYNCYKSRSTTVGTFTAVTTGDTLGTLSFAGDDGTAFTNAGWIQMRCEGTISTGVVRGLMSFETANSSGVVTQALSINSSQVATFANPIVTSGINDGSGNTILSLSSTASAVNYLQIQNRPTTQSPVFSALGTDTDIGMQLLAKGAGVFRSATTATSNQFRYDVGAGLASVNYFNFNTTTGTNTFTFPAVSGTVQLQGQKAIVPNLSTSPANSASSTLAVGTAYQNTLGYDIVLTVYLSVTAATSANILLGVGSTNTPTQQTIISSITTAALQIIPVTIYLPNQYYALLSTSGTITQTISGQQAMPV